MSHFKIAAKGSTLYKPPSTPSTHILLFHLDKSREAASQGIYKATRERETIQGKEQDSFKERDNLKAYRHRATSTFHKLHFSIASKNIRDGQTDEHTDNLLRNSNQKKKLTDKHTQTQTERMRGVTMLVENAGSVRATKLDCSIQEEDWVRGESYSANWHSVSLIPCPQNR